MNICATMKALFAKATLSNGGVAGGPASIDGFAADGDVRPEPASAVLVVSAAVVLYVRRRQN
jgi:hypothetical protein